MLTLTIEKTEMWNELTQKFVDIPGATIQLEHSLVSISKWESRWRKPFISASAKTKEETIDYIRCMTITQNVDPQVYAAITDQQITQVNQYIDNPMSAKTFMKKEGKGHVYRDVVSEDIYYLMIAYNIPWECRKWHFNRLMALIKTCEENNDTKNGKKKNRREYADYRRKLNAARKAKYGTKG